MKNIFSVLLVVGSATMAQATVIVAVCTPAPAVYSGQSGSGIESCVASYGGSNITINSVTMQTGVRVLVDPFLTATLTAAYSMTSSVGGLATSGTANNVANDLQSVSCPDQACNDAFLFGSWIVTDNYTGVAGVAGASFNKRFTIDYTAGAITNPEPSSFGLLAAGLIGLGLKRRQRSEV